MNKIESPQVSRRSRRRLRLHDRPAPRPGRPGLCGAERHDPARAGRMRHAVAAPGQHGDGEAAGRAVRRRGRSEQGHAELRRLEREGEPQHHPAVPRRADVGRGPHGHPRRAATSPSEIMETYYEKQNRPGKGMRSYEDYREMLEKETDIQGIINITPDHQHGSINIAALRKGKAAISHKPVASVLYEVRRTLQAARESSAPSHLLAYSNAPDRHTLAAWIKAGVDRHRPRSAQLDEPAVLAAGHAGVPQVRAARAGRLQLGAVAGARTGSSVSPELHVRGLPRLVRVRRRLPRGHGPLQPVAAVPHPEARGPGIRRGPAQQRRVRRRRQRQRRRARLARRLPEGQHRPLAASGHGRAGPPSTRSGTTAA